MFKSKKSSDDVAIDEPISSSLGLLLIRLVVGGMMLPHGIHKILSGIDGISGMLTANGLPSVLAYGVYIGEVLAPILLILGLFTRLSSLVLAFTMAMAIYLAHRSDVVRLGEHGEWAIEVPMMYLLLAIAIALLGTGNFALGKKTGILG
jgi:putative oxidoreductase